MSESTYSTASPSCSASLDDLLKLTRELRERHSGQGPRWNGDVILDKNLPWLRSNPITGEPEWVHVVVISGRMRCSEKVLEAIKQLPRADKGSPK